MSKNIEQLQQDVRINLRPHFPPEQIERMVSEAKTEQGLRALIGKRPTNASPSARWENLKRFILAEIDEIDNATTDNGSMIEPDWWLDMASIRRMLAMQGESKIQEGIREQLTTNNR